MSILSVRHLSKSYRSRKVVSDLSAGKTTSFNMIVGLVPSDGGTIHLDNSEISRLSIDQRSHLGLGYLPQEASVFRKLTVEDNIMAILETRMPNNRRKAKQRLELLLQEFHIAHLRDNLGMSLSGGERRRLEIARALASEPRFLLLDEPFAGIDPISISDIQRLIHRLCEHGIGILITDHNVRETLGTCDRAYIVNDGKILAEGSPELILNNEQVRDVYLGEQFSL
jgi:lipopolysaccharide export system ATP-binding protein